jgi:hypothetical protein
VCLGVSWAGSGQGIRSTSPTRKEVHEYVKPTY